MKHIWTIGLGLALAVSAGAHAQTATSSNAQTQVSTSSAAQSIASQGNGNAQNLTFNSAAPPANTRETVRSAPGVGIGSFGTSFSSDSCSSTVAGSVSLVGVGAAAGKAVMEANCAHIRRGLAFGQAAAFSAQRGDFGMAAKQVAMVNYEFCTADDETERACERLGLVVKAQDQRGASNAEVQGVAEQQVINNKNGGFAAH